MAGNVRIYELAKELGIDSAKCIELCEVLNIGTGLTASSSLPPQQADRVRFRAAREGLTNESEAKQVATSTTQRPVRQQRQQGRRQRARPGEGRRRRPPPEKSAPASASASTSAPQSEVPATDELATGSADLAAESSVDEGKAIKSALSGEAAADKLIGTLLREDTAAAQTTEAQTTATEARVAEARIAQRTEATTDAVATAAVEATAVETATAPPEDIAADDSSIAMSAISETATESHELAAEKKADVIEFLQTSPREEAIEKTATEYENTASKDTASKDTDFRDTSDATELATTPELAAVTEPEAGVVAIEQDVADGADFGDELVGDEFAEDVSVVSSEVISSEVVSSEVISSEVVSSEVVSSEVVSSEVISSDHARETISSRPAPTSVSGKPIPPPPGRSRAITVDGEAFSPGVKRSRPASRPATSTASTTETPTRTRRRPDRRGAAHVDAVFTPAQTRLPSSAGQGKGKSGRGSAAPFRPNQQRRRKGGRRRRRSVEELRPLDQQPTTTSLADAPPPEGVVEIERASTAQEVAPKLNRTTSDMIKYFLDQQEMVTATQPLPDDLIELYAEEIGAQVRIVDFEEEQEAALRRLLDLPGTNDIAGGDSIGADDDTDEDTDADEVGDDAAEDTGEDTATGTPGRVGRVSRVAPTRPPIVTIMGHVDHGKTTLLDTIRNTNITSGEAGGITQHIGAYHVKRNGKSITFIDTPGHEAFTAMRNRGANVTDIVVLVVAADDGLMPQTEEAIDHARAANVPIIVAINKVDLEGANTERARQQLAEQGLVPEAWGGDTVMEEVSALKGEGLDELLESILLMAEVQELTAPVNQRSQGVVLESHKDVGRGPVATLLVQEGTLKVGDPVVAGTVWGRVRALLDDNGEPVKNAGPSVPVQVLGLSDVAAAGDEFAVAPSQKLAEKVGREREQRHRVSDLGRDIGVRAAGAKLEDIFTGVSAGEMVTLNLVLKSDVHGSLEALVASLEKLERDNLKLSFVRRGVGGITENDVQLAAASNATIIGFNVRPDSKARQMAVKEQVEMRLYEVIYKVTEDVEAALLGMLAPEIEEHVTGEAEVREVFRVRRVGMIAGCYVRSGVMKRGTQVRFLRDGTVIWRGTIRTLKRFQEDAAEVAHGFECGIGLSDFQDLKQGDIIETFEEREVVPR